MKKILLLLTIVFALGATVRAQDSENPWLIGVSTNYVDFHVIDLSLGEQFTNACWMGNTIPGMIRLGRNINKSFNASALVANVKFEPEKLNLIPLDRTITGDKFWKYGVQLEYKFANDYLLNETSWFDPYIYLGMNGSSIDEIAYLSSSMGIGINIWFIEKLGVNFQGAYDYNWDFNDYMHYSIGLVTRFGKVKDQDGDGIIDKRDLCPEVYGLAEFDGCPDTDGDGIPDNDDACPQVAGLAEFNGCPDTDGDGIIDQKDECPQVGGLAEFNGCPDKDGDGIPDHLDNCPDIAGLAEFNGCPDNDGDGVPDHLDKCPNEAGPASKKGCPLPVIVPVEVKELIGFNTEDIEFEISSSTILKESFDELDNIVKIMNDYPDTRFTIYGYTDITGPKDFNLKLSKERANSVKKYFTNKGIDPSRLEANGFGIQNPIAPNNTREGQAKNRRVEINVKE